MQQLETELRRHTHDIDRTQYAIQQKHSSRAELQERLLVIQQHCSSLQQDINLLRRLLDDYASPPNFPAAPRAQA